MVLSFFKNKLFTTFDKLSNFYIIFKILMYIKIKIKDKKYFLQLYITTFLYKIYENITKDG